MPTPRPSTSESESAVPISSMVAGTRSRMTSSTGRPPKKVTPQFPVSIPLAHFRYWSGSGWSRPSAERRRSMSWAVMVGLSV